MGVYMARNLAYLNLSLCFLKQQQWLHASNTATRAIQGDKEPPVKEEDVLPNDKKAKALYRRATAHCEGFGNFDKAREDLKKAREYAPEDKAIENMLRKCDFAVKKTEKTADKKMNGFLKKEADKGSLFDESLRKYNTEGPKLPTEPVKYKDGLFIVPKKEESSVTDAEQKAGLTSELIEAAKNGDVDFDEVSREINELRERDPAGYEELREKIQASLVKEQEEIGKAEKQQAGEASA